MLPDLVKSLEHMGSSEYWRYYDYSASDSESDTRSSYSIASLTFQVANILNLIWVYCATLTSGSHFPHKFYIPWPKPKFPSRLKRVTWNFLRETAEGCCSLRSWTSTPPSRTGTPPTTTLPWPSPTSPPASSWPPGDDTRRRRRSRGRSPAGTSPRYPERGWRGRRRRWRCRGPCLRRRSTRPGSPGRRDRDFAGLNSPTYKLL